LPFIVKIIVVNDYFIYILSPSLARRERELEKKMTYNLAICSAKKEREREREGEKSIVIMEHVVKQTSLWRL
jgi:hypothetical protein